MNNKLFFQLHPFFLVFPGQQKPYLLLVQHSSYQAFPLSDMPEFSNRFECSHNNQNHSHLSDPVPLTNCEMVYLSGKSTLLFHIEFFHLNSLLLPSLSLLHYICCFFTFFNFFTYDSYKNFPIYS